MPNHPYLDPDPPKVVKSMCHVCNEFDDKCICDPEYVELHKSFRKYRSRYLKLKSMNMVQRARLWKRVALGEDMDAIIDRMEMPKP